MDSERLTPPPPSHPLLPDERGYFGAYGGCYVPEILIPNLRQLEKVFDELRADQSFWADYIRELQTL